MAILIVYSYLDLLSALDIEYILALKVHLCQSLKLEFNGWGLKLEFDIAPWVDVYKLYVTCHIAL